MTGNIRITLQRQGHLSAASVVPFSAQFFNKNMWPKNGKANVIVRLTLWLLVKAVGTKMPPWPVRLELTVAVF